MQEFINPERIELKVHDVKDNVHTFKLKPLSCNELDLMAKINMDFEPGTAVRKQLSLMFGEGESFYTKFDTRVLTKVLKYITAEIKDPS